MKERRGKETTKEVASELFPVFDTAANRKSDLILQRKENACSLLEKWFGFGSVFQLGTETIVFLR